MLAGRQANRDRCTSPHGSTLKGQQGEAESGSTNGNSQQAEGEGSSPGSVHTPRSGKVRAGGGGVAGAGRGLTPEAGGSQITVGSHARPPRGQESSPSRAPSGGKRQHLWRESHRARRAGEGGAGPSDGLRLGLGVGAGIDLLWLGQEGARLMDEALGALGSQAQRTHIRPLAPKRSRKPITDGGLRRALKQQSRSRSLIK